MDEKKLTPEDRLLKAIEKPKEQGRPIRPLRQAKLRWQAPALSLRLVNNALIISAALVTILFVFGFVSDRMRFKKRFALIVQTSPTEAKEALERPAIKVDLAPSLRQAKKRNIFTLKPQAPVIKKRTPRKDITTLKLVGILWSKNPQVMIEDTEENKTYLLNAGEEISRWKVEKIYRDRVVLINEAGKWELR